MIKSIINQIFIYTFCLWFSPENDAHLFHLVPVLGSQQVGEGTIHLKRAPTCVCQMFT